MTRPALLDVNVLVALFDPGHIHHDPAHDWFADNCSHGWATCPLTENGFVRVLANPASGGPVARASELLSRLEMFCRAEDHQFWPDAVSLRDETRFDPAMVTGHRQLTDIYLLGLATFDRTIPVKAVVAEPRPRRSRS